jgi:hypothetical protein
MFPLSPFRSLFAAFAFASAVAAPPALAGDYLGTQSCEFALRGETTIDVPAALVRRLGETRAVEKALEDDDRYYNLVHFVSSYFLARRLTTFARGSSFSTVSARRLRGDRFEVTFQGLIGGRSDLIDRMQARGLFRSGHRFLVPFPTDVSGMAEHDWYEFDPDAFSGEVVQVPVTIRVLPNVGDSYPDYRRLFEDGVLEISVFYGYDGGDEDGPGGNDLLVAREFHAKITDLARRTHFSDPVHEHFGRIRNSTTFTRTILADVGHGPQPVEVRLRLFYRRSPKVKYHFRHALKHSDVVIYDGHSTYGGGFSLSPTLFFANPEDIAALDREMRAERTADRYQVLFVNACHSYGYYPDMFYDVLSRKDPGNLDIVTTIEAADFADSVKTDVKLIDMVAALAPGTRRPLHRARSWQEIVRTLNAGLTSRVCYAVHGTADNPRRPYGEPAAGRGAHVAPAAIEAAGSGSEAAPEAPPRRPDAVRTDLTAAASPPTRLDPAALLEEEPAGADPTRLAGFWRAVAAHPGRRLVDVARAARGVRAPEREP